MVTKRSQTKRLTVFSRRKNTCVSNNLFLRYCSTFLWLMTTTNGAIKNVILLLHVHKTFPLLYYSRQRTAWKSKAKKWRKGGEMRERGDSLTFTLRDWKNKSTGHVSSVNLVVSKSLLHNTKTSPMLRPTAIWSLKVWLGIYNQFYDIPQL